jgi:hypothetical protein
MQTTNIVIYLFMGIVFISAYGKDLKTSLGIILTLTLGYNAGKIVTYFTKWNADYNPVMFIIATLLLSLCFGLIIMVAILL